MTKHLLQVQPWNKYLLVFIKGLEYHPHWSFPCITAGGQYCYHLHFINEETEASRG